MVRFVERMHRIGRTINDLTSCADVACVVHRVTLHKSMLKVLCENMYARFWNPIGIISTVSGVRRRDRTRRCCEHVSFRTEPGPDMCKLEHAEDRLIFRMQPIRSVVTA